MTIDEAIKLCEEDAEKSNPQSDRHAESFRQLAEWLKELKELRKDDKDFLKKAIYTLEKVMPKYRRLSEENQKQKEQIAEYERLLSMALCELNNGTCSKFCSTCTKVNTEKCLDYKTKCYRWIHTDEALKLIGE